MTNLAQGNLQQDNTPPTTADLIAAYALGSLAPDEIVQVEALLATSEDARVELRNVESILTGMAALVPVRRAPATLTANFRAQLAAQEAQTPLSDVVTHVESSPTQAKPPAAAYQVVSSEVPKPIARTQISSEARKSSTPIRVNSWRAIRTWRFVAAAALLLVVVGIFVFYRSISNDSEQRRMQQIMAAADAKHVEMSAQQGASGRVTLVMTPNSTEAVLVAELPLLPDTNAYQLWMVKDKKRESVLVFRAEDGDQTRLLIKMEDPITSYDTAGITIEPRVGSPAPTTKPIFTVKTLH